MDQPAFPAEPLIRLGCFLGILAVMAFWEWRLPRRPQTFDRVRRWPDNFGLVVLNTALMRVLLPFAGVGMALMRVVTDGGCSFGFLCRNGCRSWPRRCCSI